MASEASKPAKWLGLGGWLILTFSASASAYFISTGDWYASLQKPSWNPPSWVFGPAWTTLYLMMAVAVWKVWLSGGWRKQTLPLTAFLIQWLLNAAWTPLFFAAHLLGWALIEIVVLWVAIVVTTFLFYRVNRVAGTLMLPYLAWVSFASFLNFTIWRLN